MSQHVEHVVQLGNLHAAAAWFARLVSDGAVEVDAQGAQVGDELWLKLQVDGEGTFGAQAKVVELAGDRARCTLNARADFRELIARYAFSRRAGRTDAIDDGTQRKFPRFSTCLKARFRSYQHLVDEYVTNISEGGMFIRTSEPPEIGTHLTVEVAFPDGNLHEVNAEVVWRSTGGGEGGKPPGIGVRFLESQKFHAALDSLLVGYLARKPKVLLVDDNPFFLRVLADVLMERSIEVATANGGPKALHLLNDLLYELDLVVLDLNMPKIDGRALLERLRRLGKEMDVKIAIVSAASEEGMARLVRPGGADLALSKDLGIPEIAQRLLAFLRHA